MQHIKSQLTTLFELFEKNYATRCHSQWHKQPKLKTRSSQAPDKKVAKSLVLDPHFSWDAELVVGHLVPGSGRRDDNDSSHNTLLHRADPQSAHCWDSRSKNGLPEAVLAENGEMLGGRAGSALDARTEHTVLLIAVGFGTALCQLKHLQERVRKASMGATI